jgi:hypothetical protein
MKNTKTFQVCIILLSALSTISCDGLPSSSGSFKSFDSRLRGTWNSNDPSKYSGSLKIEIDTITIVGYGESQTPSTSTPTKGNDNERPFKDYPKNIPLKGYSEDGKIFIEYGGAQNGIPYTYTETGTYTNKKKLLTFNFGGRNEILECPMDY